MLLISISTLIDTALDSNHRWRPVGLGLMGLQDALFKLNTAFDSEKGMQVSKKVQEEIYYHALKASMELSKKYGPHII